MRKKLQTLAILMLGMAFMVNAQVTRLEIPIVKNGTQITDTIYVEDENGEDVIHSEVTFSLSSDDAEEIKNVLDGTHEIDDLNDDDLDLGWEGEADDNNIVNVGLRFQNVEIPKGAKIIRSYVRVVSHEVKTVDDDANIKIYGEASDNAETFTEDALITDRNKTNAVIDWKADQPWGLWTVEYSPDISEIVQEIVDRGGWASGNSLALIMEGENQGPSENENKREFEAFENISDPEDGGDGQHHPDRVPKLVVYYSAGESTSISSFTSSVSTVDVYPNPAAYGELNVALQSVENAQIDIYNLTGKLVYSANTNPTQKVTTLDVSNFETGFYFIKVTQNNTVYSQKVLIK